MRQILSLISARETMIVEDIFTSPGLQHIAKNIIDTEALDPVSLARCRLVQRKFRDLIDEYDLKQLYVYKIHGTASALLRPYLAFKTRLPGGKRCFFIDYQATFKIDEKGHVKECDSLEPKRRIITRDIKIMENPLLEHFPAWSEILRCLAAIDMSTEKSDLIAISQRLMDTDWSRMSTKCGTDFTLTVNPLHIAVLEGDESFVRYLFKNVGDYICMDHALVYYACTKDHLNILKSIVQNMVGINLDSYPQWHAPLVVDGSHFGDPPVPYNRKAILRRQIAEGKDPQVFFKKPRPIYSHEKNYSPFQVACKNGCIDVVKCLLLDLDQYSIEESENTLDGMTPIDLAMENEHYELAKFMLEYEKSKPSKKLGRKPFLTKFYNACAKGQIDVVKFLLDKLSALDNGSEYLTIACKNGHTKLVEFMYKNPDKFRAFAGPAPTDKK